MPIHLSTFQVNFVFESTLKAVGSFVRVSLCNFRSEHILFLYHQQISKAVFWSLRALENLKMDQYRLQLTFTFGAATGSSSVLKCLFVCPLLGIKSCSQPVFLLWRVVHVGLVCPILLSNVIIWGDGTLVGLQLVRGERERRGRDGVKGQQVQVKEEDYAPTLIAT